MPRMPCEEENKSQYQPIKIIEGGIWEGKKNGGDLHLPIGYPFLEDWERSWFLLGDANDGAKRAANLKTSQGNIRGRGGRGGKIVETNVEFVAPGLKKIGR
jgi:hypothetical protein